MGLDMYLTRKFYVKNWEHTPAERRHEIIVKTGDGDKKSSIPADKISFIETEEIYWRKANQIHKWFVDNVQGGKDDCRPYYVSKEQLQMLLDLVTEVLASTKLKKGRVVNGWSYTKNGKMKANKEDGKVIVDPTVAKKLLPVASGFFFGGTEYDQWYYDDLVYTKEHLTQVLSKKDEGIDTGDFYYQSSW